MFICRLSLAMHVPPSVIEQMSARDVTLLARYWEEEPWGSLRDNMHAAIIAREVRRPWLKDPTRNSLDDFMILARRDIAEQRAQKHASIFTALKSIATHTTRAEVAKRKRKKRRRGKQS